MGKCQICSVDIPDGEGSQEVHETGKRHMRLRAFQESVLTLADRSVFLKWVNTEGQPILDKLAIAKVMSKSGAIDRILFRAGTTHAIVEFISISSTKDVLSQKIVHINGVKVNCCKRLMQFPSYEKQSIDINQVIVQAQESDGFIAQIDSIMEQIEINKDQILLRENCAKRLEMELGKYFVSPRVRIFGSSVTSIGIVDSDIDACLCFDATPFEQKLSPELSRDKHTLLTCDAFLLKGRRVHAEEIIRLTPADRARFLSKVLNEVRKEVGWLGQQRPIVDARCPIVRFIADKLMLVDLSIDNYLGCAKSDYLKGLIESDISGNIRRILLGFRFWAMSNELFEPSPVQMKGHFNAYVLNLMCIGYMQSIGLIPVFSHSATEVLSGIWRIDFSIPRYDLSSLDLTQFFKNLFVHFVESDIKNTVYSVRDGCILLKDVFLHQYSSVIPEFKFGHLNVQDPIELSHNVSQNICERSISLMRRCMMLSLASLKKSRDSFCSLLSLSFYSKKTETSNDVIDRTDSSFIISEFPEWFNNKKAAILLEDIMENVFRFEIDSEPSCKRNRNEQTCDSEYCLLGPFIVRHRLWMGRRNIRRKFIADHPQCDEMTIETEVSRILMRELSHGEILARIQFILSVLSGSLRIGIIGIEGTRVDVINIAHFLNQMLIKLKLEMGSARKEHEVLRQPDKVVTPMEE